MSDFVQPDEGKSAKKGSHEQMWFLSTIVCPMQGSCNESIFRTDEKEKNMTIHRLLTSFG